MQVRPRKLPGLTVVLPCFDEAANLERAVHAACAAAAAASREYEVIVVDDGSRDGSDVIAAALVDRDPHVRLLVHGENRGYGDAVRSGIAAARMPWILLTDADLQFDLHQLADFIPYADSADLLVGWRIQRSDALNRRLNAAAWNWLVRRLFHLPVRDVDCAFKLMRTSVVQPIPLTSRGAMISTELLVRSLAAGARLEELGVHHRPRVAGAASGASPRVILRAFRELAVLRRVLPGRTPAV
jgi:glycosyltransferase involved in cell wall biosynthesis